MAVARNGAPVRIAPAVTARLKRARKIVERFAAGEQAVYGLNTGLGAAVDTALGKDQVAAFQRQAIMAAAAAAPADGYTLVLTPTNSLTVNQALYKDLPFDTARDFLPLTILATVPNVLVVNKTVPAATLAELVAYAKANPGKLSFASPGLATGAHLAGELLKLEAGIDMQGPGSG